VTLVVVGAYRVTPVPWAAGHFWMYAQYLDGLRRFGCDVWWLEELPAGAGTAVDEARIESLRERLRPLGLADRIRNTGLPPEYRNDVAMCVSVLGTELSRIKLPSRAGRVRGEKGADGHWPCAEWGHRINQLHLEPLLFAHAAAQPCIRILNRTQFEEFIQDSNVVTAIARDLDSGEPATIRCGYLALRWRPFDGAQGDRRRASRHPDLPACAVDFRARILR